MNNKITIELTDENLAFIESQGMTPEKFFENALYTNQLNLNVVRKLVLLAVTAADDVSPYVSRDGASAMRFLRRELIKLCSI